MEAKHNDEPCVICLEPIEEKATIKGCSHNFCLACIRNWAQTNTSCPLCKLPFDVIVNSSEEEYVEPANASALPRKIEEELECLDHGFFLGEVQRLLHDAERMHVKLIQESRSSRGISRWERDRLDGLEQVVAELRNHKRRLQSLLQFDPHTVLQDLYRLQDTLQDVWSNDGRNPNVRETYTPPARYGADDADNISDDDFDEDMAYLSISKNNRRMVVKPTLAAVTATSTAPASAKKPATAAAPKRNKKKEKRERLAANLAF